MPADISKFVRDPDLARMVGKVFVTLAGSHEAETEETLADARQMVDVVTFVAALLVEADPHARMPRDIRLRAEEVGRRVHEYSKAIRAENERREDPLIMEFGGLRSVPMDSTRPN